MELEVMLADVHAQTWSVDIFAIICFFYGANPVESVEWICILHSVI